MTSAYSTYTGLLFDDLGKSPPESAADQLVALFKRERQPFELFEAMKMRTRLSLGLPPVAHESHPPLPESTQRKLEDGLLEACRATGMMLLDLGRIREGWMYLRPVGETAMVARRIAKIPVTEENAEDFINVLLHEGVDVGRGFAMLLERNGTCNSITTFEQILLDRPKDQQRAAATILLKHLYRELLENVRGDLSRRDQQAPAENLTLGQLITNRPELLADGAYHLDTSHLGATVRFARVVDNPAEWEMAWELAEYGRRLNPQLQYPGEEPFHDVYPMHASYFGVLLNRDRVIGLELFAQKARTLDVQEHGTAAIETYIDLLDRIGEPRQALQNALAMIPQEVPLARIIGWLIDLAHRANGTTDLMEYCRKRNDPLAFTAALTSSRALKSR